MNEKIALVTGANKGIGRETARLLLAEGVTVLIGSRDAARGQAAAEELGASALTIDVTDQESVEAAAKEVDQRYGRLDILVNNAGINPPGQARPSETTAEVVRTAYETNVFGVVRVTNAFLPLLRRSTSPRIVNVSSELGSLAISSDPGWYADHPMLLAYSTSKSAVNSLTVMYAHELAADGIKVNAAAPGLCATDLNEYRGSRTAADGAAVIARVALAADDVPSGQFLAEAGIVPW
ncbi:MULTISPECIES: SDR family oxidoreductase [Amycolatopsis]|uniref:NADP-dependent 3-hydroxy acid dehydrogenase YdfG n=2 Tax=Amycolatopsis TaxID=1813 RepID=A0A1I3NEN9_9PSEU|nr:SDR family oxidoreductase [Amycolatopsis sacchari]SFJ07764.1 NADP-dependent 3-hydroxy acid dehydrogenase YdfG [Amycolatopsis sacchari]